MRILISTTRTFVVIPKEDLLDCRYRVARMAQLTSDSIDDKVQLGLDRLFIPINDTSLSTSAYGPSPGRDLTRRTHIVLLAGLHIRLVRQIPLPEPLQSG